MVLIFIARELLKTLILWVAVYAGGSLVYYKKVKVNYTRKIGHFTIFFLTAFFASIFHYEKSWLTGFLSLLFFLITIGIFIRPIHNRSPFVQRMFLAFDRPEDRPHTLHWFYTQMFAGIVAMCIGGSLLSAFGYTEMNVLVPLLAMIGDGLAEPVGVRFGKHKYKVYALFTEKNYHRTIEGSATVFISGIVVLLFSQGLFTTPEFSTALILVPITMTIVEAIAPHTLDQPFLNIFGSAILFLIKFFI
jgi:phytol kinase